jgi:hypothetical protein
MRTRVVCFGSGIRFPHLFYFATGWVLCALLSEGIAAHRGDRYQQAEGLVREALAHQVLGLSHERDRLLAEAHSTDPDYPPAHWHQGRVKIGDKWSEVETLSETDAQRRLREAYQQRRQGTPDSIAAQMALADWCAARRLPLQEMAHLHQVIQRDPNHRVARHRLDQRQFGGRWVDGSDFWRGLQNQQRMQTSIATWRDRLLRAAASRQNGPRHEATLNRLRSEIDVQAVPAIEAVLAPRSEAAAMLAVELLDDIPAHEASQTLVRIAVLSPWAEVRGRAAAQLHRRPRDHYVPLLLAELSTPIESRVAAAMIGGQILYRHQFSRETQESRQMTMLDTTLVRRPSLVQTATGSPGMVNREAALESLGAAVAATRARALTEMQQAMLWREQQRIQQNLRIGVMNQRIYQVLSTATGEVLPASPRAWWDWWEESNGVQIDGDKSTDGRYHAAVHVYQDAQPAIASGGRTGTSSSPLPRRADCFVAGTPVWTIAGPQPIEEIRVGDLVLSQNVQTGELAYQPVLQTSTRPAEPLFRVTLANRSREMLEGSGGHPLWVAGDGWRMLRELESGSLLHGIGGGVLVSDVEDGDMAETYNLVVADFHTYVVGYAKILCHDNTPRQPTNAVLPGLIPQ